jgi:purine-binding chemotaxis protein CheW
MALAHRFVRFTLGDLEFGLPLAAVERVLLAMAVAPLPGAPPVILGVVNVHGDVLPVADMRSRFGLAPRPLDPGDHFVVASTPARRLALAVDSASGVVECPARDLVEAASVVPGMEHVKGIARTGDGLLLIQDLDRFLALDEEAALQEALDRA